MAGFTVLTDPDVQGLLRTAGQAEISQFADILTKTLQEYSTTDEVEYQPHRAVVTRPTNQTTLFMPSTSTDYLGVKVVGVPGPAPRGQSRSQTQKPSKLEATLTMANATGQAIGVLNAAELTAFRTSLGAMLLYRNRTNVQNLVMFGSGKQAYWHIRLALILKGPDIKTITVVNRTKARAEELVDSLNDLFKQHPHITVSTLITSDPDSTTKLKTAVTSANTIHCAVPSTEPLFPADWLTISPSSSSSLRKDLYISAIGSYKLNMQELDPTFLKHLISSTRDLYIPPDRTSPVVIVDSLSGCFQEAGELVAAELKEEHLLEIGRLTEIIQSGKAGKGLEEWLATGLVVYKSVGIGVMDICIGKALIDLAREKGIGVNVPDF